MTWRATSRAWHAEDIRRSIRLAERLGQHRVVTTSGLPGGEPGASRPNWIVNAWNSAALDVLDHQWRIVADFWRETDRLARDQDVKVARELHPQNVAFNCADVHRLIDLTGATHVGVELDASHLFWQQMDPVAVVRHLGEPTSGPRSPPGTSSPSGRATTSPAGPSSCVPSTRSTRTCWSTSIMTAIVAMYRICHEQDIRRGHPGFPGVAAVDEVAGRRRPGGGAVGPHPRPVLAGGVAVRHAALR
ncbi:sugar phosphate isomerase/epimerase family protein [Streptomyces sp. NPDC001165]|uniref:sugar phosphate isomerase/epimerase family protein n=1 Tax=Streptomyces sp. NPDC001165 TaxID=3364546 RepID=UPI0036B0D792